MGSLVGSFSPYPIHPVCQDPMSRPSYRDNMISSHKEIGVIFSEAFFS
jgi:hypothetical protein